MATQAPDAMSPQLALSKVQALLVDRCRGKSVRIYEAGGGSISYIPLSSLDNPKVTVVDIDETQLRNNKYAHVKIQGDIQTYEFPASSFDLIVCYNVIEHLRFVDQAIRQFHHGQHSAARAQW